MYSKVDKNTALIIKRRIGYVYLLILNFLSILLIKIIIMTPSPYIGVQGPYKIPLSTWVYTKFSMMCPIIENIKKTLR
jgi:hypothetical protein